MEFGYLFKSVAALLFIILLANVLLKKIHTLSGKQNGAITIIERIPVSKTSSIGIVEIANQHYLMSFTDSGSEILKEFSPAEAKEFAKSPSMTFTQNKRKSAKLPLKGFRKQYSEMFEKKV